MNLDVQGRRSREKRRHRFTMTGPPYFLFRFTRGGSPAVVAAFDSSGSGSASSATSDVLLRPTTTGCSENTFVAPAPVPGAEPDPGAADPDTDILSLASGAPPSPSCTFAKAVKNASKSKSAAVCAGGIPSDDGTGGECVEAVEVLVSAGSRPMFSIRALILSCSTSTSASMSLAS